MLESANEIEKISKNILLSAKVWGVRPTPVDKIVQFANLQIETGVDLSKVEPGFFSKNFQVARQALNKVLGIIDRRQKVIYLDHAQNITRKNFVKLHEVGHDVCVWQAGFEYIDDEQTISPETKEMFECEANYFASCTLFQHEIFDDEIEKLPLSLKSAMHLGKMFGGSTHATIRRYVEKSKKRCALLVLNKPENKNPFHVSVRNYFQSTSFTKEFGSILWPDACNLSFPFVQEIMRGQRLHEKGQINLLVASSDTVSFKYHFFNNSYNTFVLFLPIGEENKSRISFLPS